MNTYLQEIAIFEPTKEKLNNEEFIELFNKLRLEGELWEDEEENDMQNKNTLEKKESEEKEKKNIK